MPLPQSMVAPAPHPMPAAAPPAAPVAVPAPTPPPGGNKPAGQEVHNNRKPPAEVNAPGAVKEK